MNKIKVLIIDDSALTRAVLSKILQKDDNIEIIGTAVDPIVAQKKISMIKPDVITLDLEMPRMDGLTFLKKLMKENPIPTIVISGNSPKSSVNAIKSLELGAIDIIEKPDISTPEKLSNVSTIIIECVKAASAAKHINYKKSASTQKVNQADNTTSRKVNGHSALKFVNLIGASTGGPDIIRYLLSNVRNRNSAFVVAQHMPALFTKSYSARLNQLCGLTVDEAKDGDYIEPGKVLVLPGDSHGVIKRDVNGFFIALNQKEKVNRHRPSIDVLFNSAVKIPNNKLRAILLTGMGEDGARGLKKLHSYGATTIAQDASSCVVYGMPKKAVEMGAASAIFSPDQIIDALNKN